jgi:hypothetical protein
VSFDLGLPRGNQAEPELSSSLLMTRVGTAERVLEFLLVLLGQGGLQHGAAVLAHRLHGRAYPSPFLG